MSNDKRDSGRSGSSATAGSSTHSGRVTPDGLYPLVLYRRSSQLSLAVVRKIERRVREQVRKREDQEQVLLALHCIVTNLSDWLHDLPSRREISGVAVSLNPSSYTRRNRTDVRFNGNRWIGYSALTQALDFLEKRGWIVLTKGKAKFGAGADGRTVAHKGRGTRSRILPSTKLEELDRQLHSEQLTDRPRRQPMLVLSGGQVVLAEPEPLPQVIPDYIEHFGRIRLKPSDDESDAVPDIAEEAPNVLSDLLQERLEAFNRMNIEHDWVIDWPGYDRLGHPVEGIVGTRICAPALIYSRIFNRGSWELNGRFYSAVSSVERAHRQHITVNGKDLVEADFVSLHIRLAYDLLYEETPSLDCYDLGHYGEIYLGHLHPKLRRELVKCLMLSLLNKRKGTLLQGLNGLLHGCWKAGKWHNGYWAVTLRKIREGISYKRTRGLSLSAKEDLDFPEQWDMDLDVKPALEAIHYQHNEVAAEYLGKDRGLFLQNLDSRIADIVALRFTEIQQPLLILHDGFFTSPENANLLIESMQSAYQEVVGVAMPRDGIELKRRIK